MNEALKVVERGGHSIILNGIRGMSGRRSKVPAKAVSHTAALHQCALRDSPDYVSTNSSPSPRSSPGVMRSEGLLSRWPAYAFARRRLR